MTKLMEISTLSFVLLEMSGKVWRGTRNRSGRGPTLSPFFPNQFCVPLTKLNHALLGPEALVSSVVRNKCAAPAVLRGDNGNQRVAHNCGVPKRAEIGRPIHGVVDGAGEVVVVCQNGFNGGAIVRGLTFWFIFLFRFRISKQYERTGNTKSPEPAGFRPPTSFVGQETVVPGVA